MPEILEALKRWLADDTARRGLELSPAKIRRRAVDFCDTGHVSTHGTRSVRLARSSSYAPTVAARRERRHALERQALEQ